MDVSEQEYKLEDIPEGESKVLDDLVRESVDDENSEPVKDTSDGDHERSEELEVGLDPVTETEPSLDLTKPSLSEDFTQAVENPEEGTTESKVEEPVAEDINGISNTAEMYYASKGVGSLSDQVDEVSSVVTESVSNGAEETILQPEEPPAAVDVPGKTVAIARNIDAGNGGGEDSTLPEVPNSTENQAYVSVTPRLPQRSSWWDCCGLFRALRRSDQ